MRYDRTSLSFQGMEAVSVLTLAGRLKVALVIIGYQPAPRCAAPGQYYLSLVNKEFYLAAVLNVPDALPASVMRALNGAGELLFPAEEMPAIEEA